MEQNHMCSKKGYGLKVFFFKPLISQTYWAHLSRLSVASSLQLVWLNFTRRICTLTPNCVCFVAFPLPHGLYHTHN